MTTMFVPGVSTPMTPMGGVDQAQLAQFQNQQFQNQQFQNQQFQPQTPQPQQFQPQTPQPQMQMSQPEMSQTQFQPQTPQPQQQMSQTQFQPQTPQPQPQQQMSQVPQPQVNVPGLPYAPASPSVSENQMYVPHTPVPSSVSSPVPSSVSSSVEVPVVVQNGLVHQAPASAPVHKTPAGIKLGDSPNSAIMVDYAEFVPERVSSLSPKEETFEKKKPDGNVEKGKYYEIGLQHLYMTPKGPQTDGFFLQHPEVDFDPLKESTGLNGYLETQAKMKYDLNDPNCIRFIGKSYRSDDIADSVMGRFLFRVGKTAIEPNKNKIGIPLFKTATLEDMIGTGLKNPIYWPKDDSGFIDNKNPTQYCKVMSSTAFITIVKGEDGNPKGVPIERALLKRVTFRGIPLVHYSHVYASGNKNANVQYKLVSVVVTKMTEINNADKQLATIKNLMSGNVDIEGLGEKLANLTSKFQDEIEAEKQAKQKRKEEAMAAKDKQKQGGQPGQQQSSFANNFQQGGYPQQQGGYPQQQGGFPQQQGGYPQQQQNYPYMQNNMNPQQGLFNALQNNDSRNTQPQQAGQPGMPQVPGMPAMPGMPGVPQMPNIPPQILQQMSQTPQGAPVRFQ